MTFRVHVDPDRCQGHNRCYSIAPGLFELDDLGMSAEIGDGLVPGDLVAAARRAQANCPEHAVSVSPVSPVSPVSSVSSETEAARS